MSTNGNANHPPQDLGHGIHARVMLVTPEIAKKWLERNHEDQRTISAAAVEAIANDIRRGAWRLTHQAIAFDAESRLIDGQHRLSAIMAAEEPAYLLVVWNKATGLHDPIDRIRARTVAFITGRDSKTTAALAALRSFEVGYQVCTTLTVAEADDLHARHGEAIGHIKNDVAGAHKMFGGLLAACVWALPVDRVKVTEFAQKVTTGEMIGRGDPAWAFRSWKERNLSSSSWVMALAAFNCIRHHIVGATIANVHIGEMGYRAITTKRRALKVPGTPDASLVPTATWSI